MTDLQAPTTDETATGTTSASPESSPASSPESDTTSSTASVSEQANVTAPSTTLAAVLPTSVKETFLQKMEVDVEEAYHYLIAEIRKIYTSL